MGGSGPSINQKGSALIHFTYGHLPEISLEEKKKKKNRVHCNSKQTKEAINFESPHRSSPVFLKLERASDLLES